eukprot:jgi/Chlat1/6788/Chrsp51S00505
MAGAAAAALVDRVRGALWGMFIADALAMPVHWYYNVDALRRDYGTVNKYMAPKEFHPGKPAVLLTHFRPPPLLIIMSLSSTSRAGRGSQPSNPLIGSIINHGKASLWGKRNVHYHHGMRAGDNTLNALCARVVMRGISGNGGVYDEEVFLKDYVEFMTTKGTHGDTYAEGFHRDFFANWAKGVEPRKCAGKEGHDTASAGGLVTLPPVIFSSLLPPSTTTNNKPHMLKTTLSHLKLTHDSPSLSQSAGVYAELLADVAVGGADVREAVLIAGKKLGVDIKKLADRRLDDTQVVGGVFTSACYISGSLPSVLYLAYKYADNFEAALVANAGCGGDSCHRGSALGALLGGATGESGIRRRAAWMIEGLREREEIEREIGEFVEGVGSKRREGDGDKSEL